VGFVQWSRWKVETHRAPNPHHADVVHESDWVLDGSTKELFDVFISAWRNLSHQFWLGGKVNYDPNKGFD
jgi:hypothetical protein